MSMHVHTHRILRHLGKGRVYLEGVYFSSCPQAVSPMETCRLIKDFFFSRFIFIFIDELLGAILGVRGQKKEIGEMGTDHFGVGNYSCPFLLFTYIV